VSIRLRQIVILVIPTEVGGIPLRKRSATSRDPSTPLRSAQDGMPLLASAHFQLFSQNPMQQNKQYEYGPEQDYRVESEYAERDSEIAFLETEENVWLAATAVIVLLHLRS
jgi:hypothetical protein